VLGSNRARSASRRVAVIGAGIAGVPAVFTRPAAAQSAGSKPIKIGFMVHRTGIGAVYGRWYERTTIAAVKLINKMGGIAGRPVELVTEDDGTDPKRGAEVVEKLAVQHKVDFMILDPIPMNHQFWYYQTGNKNPDFDRRLSLYKQFATPIGNVKDTRHKACQILAILPNKVDSFEELKTKFEDIKIIRATSPLDHESIWMEIFPKHISKGFGCQWLCNHLGVLQEESIVVGNDYNDIDLLEWGKHAFVVENAPKELKLKYQLTANVIDDGFAIAIEKVLSKDIISLTSRQARDQYL